MLRLPTFTMIGAGSLGSYAALALAECFRDRGVKFIVCDFDRVELHNTMNQLYRPEDVGRYKVEALADIVRFMTGIEIEARSVKIESGMIFRTPVITLVDSMRARKEIFAGARFEVGVPLYIDARSGGPDARVYGFDPRDADHVRRYERTLYGDEDAAPVPCARQEDVPTLLSVASAIVHIVNRHLKIGMAIDEFTEVVIDLNNAPQMDGQIRTGLYTKGSL